MIRIPLIALPDQRLQIILGNQDVTLRVYTRMGGPRPPEAPPSPPRAQPDSDLTRDNRLYTDLGVAGAMIWRGFIARNLLPCKLYPYLPFAGQLVFVDMRGLDDPRWQGLGARWVCMYLTDAETAELFPERNP